MSTTLQIRNLPEDLKERLRSRAQGEDMTMSEYVIRLVKKDLGQPTMKQWLADLEKLPVRDDLPPGIGAQLLREEWAERAQA